MKINIKKPSDKDLMTKDVMSWPIWEKEISRFSWYYDSTEECFLLEGEVVVETEDGHQVSFGKGDFVTFPKGLSCIWNIKAPVRKHYNFK